MGTDIHIYVEYKKDGEWTELHAPYHKGRWGSRDHNTWSPWREYVYDDEGNYLGMDDMPPDPTGRNYYLFSFLAGVRDGYGDGDPKFPDRGIPEDTSWREPVYDQYYERVGGNEDLGDHSFTWATMQELLNVFWDTEIRSTGVVSHIAYEKCKQEGQPDRWSAGVYGGSVKHISNEEMDEKIADGTASGCYTEIEWDWTPLKNCGFHRWLIETLEPMAKSLSVSPEEVRILMGFDS